MIVVNINYPNPHIHFHTDGACPFIPENKPTNQRNLMINELTITDQLTKFRNERYKFDAKKGLNGMWLTIDFNDLELEKALMNYIAKYIGEKYPPLRIIESKKHC